MRIARSDFAQSQLHLAFDLAPQSKPLPRTCRCQSLAVLGNISLRICGSAADRAREDPSLTKRLSIRAAMADSLSLEGIQRLLRDMLTCGF
jgi:hypothetical protein